MRLPRKTSGYKSDTINEIIDYLRATQLVAGPDHRIEQLGNGTIIRNARQTNAPLPYNKAFDLYDRTDESFKIRWGKVFVQGVSKTINPGVSGDTCDNEITISESTWVYIKILMSATPTVTLEVNTSIPDGDDDEENYPLWYIPWANGGIDRAGIMDHRCSIHLTGMST